MIHPPATPVRVLQSRRLTSWAARLTAGFMALALFPLEADAKSYGSGGGRSFSSGSRSSGGGSSYSSGRSSYSSGSSGKAPSASTSRSGYDSSAARAKQQADSQTRYAGSKPPPVPSGSTSTSGSGGYNSGNSTYRSSGTPPPIPQSYGGSYSSSGNFYGGSSQPYRRSYSTGAKAAMIGAAVLAPALLVYASRPPVYYHDSYGSPFWWWLLDQPRDVRSTWLYHHQAEMDAARRAELLRADPALQGEVDALAAKNVPIDPNYAPPGLKTDDMFADPASQSGSSASSSSSSHGSSGLFWLTALGGGAAAAWLLFVKRWQTAPAA